VSIVNKPFDSLLTLREEGQVELSEETPNGLSAIQACEKLESTVKWKKRRASSYIAPRRDKRRFQFQKRVSFLSAHAFLRSQYKTKLTLNSCIALSSSTNAVRISSVRTMKRVPSR
jgi:hypothetical protein